jgi:RNA 3'-terminal phosphate cyclase (ATP)
MIEIDGSLGEGGGQVLRSATSLSCITGKPFHIFNIRRGRSKPGLMRQHLVAVQAAARICDAELSGVGLGSTQLSFRPRRVSAGDYVFDIGSAGSTPLVLQTLIPPLLLAGAPSRLTLSGGTHVPFSPSWHYLAEVFAPALLRLGARIELSLDACGYYPKGGGKVRCRIFPCAGFSALNLRHRGDLLQVSGISAVTNLPRSIAERQAAAAQELLRSSLGSGVPMTLSREDAGGIGQGTFIFLKSHYEHSLCGFTALGALGKPAELVSQEAAQELLSHHETGMPVDPHLADQLVLYLALANASSTLETSRVTGHLETNLQVTALFVELDFRIIGQPGAPGSVIIMPKADATKWVRYPVDVS